MENIRNTDKQNKRKKMLLIAAISATVLLAVSTFTLAWFSWQASLKSVVKVKNPSKIQILAGNTEDVSNINIGNISLASLNDEKRITHKDDNGEVTGYSRQYVFSVCSENDSYGLPSGYNYTVQLGHTTNLDFTYKLYRVSGKAKEVTSYTEDDLAGIQSGALAEYESADKVTKYLYQRGEEVKLTKIEADDSETYGTFTGENQVQTAARPVYLKTDGQEPAKFSETDEEYETWYFTDYYILEVCWDYGVGEKAVPSTKETDMAYLVVYDNQS
jgi:hypothetical protein